MAFMLIVIAFQHSARANECQKSQQIVWLARGIGGNSRWSASSVQLNWIIGSHIIHGWSKLERNQMCMRDCWQTYVEWCHHHFKEIRMRARWLVSFFAVCLFVFVLISVCVFLRQLFHTVAIDGAIFLVIGRIVVSFGLFLSFVPCHDWYDKNGKSQTNCSQYKKNIA